MTDYPRFAQTKNRKYKINTDFRVALRCNKMTESDISDEERGLALIYLLFGEEGLKHSEDWQELLQLGLKYLRCGKEVQEDNEEEEVDMDFEQDWKYIRTSFFYDYKKKITKNTYMHWWEFYELLCGLSEKCILSRIRFTRNFDISQIKDSKELEKWIKLKEQVALRKEEVKTSEEKRLDELFEQQLKRGV